MRRVRPKPLLRVIAVLFAVLISAPSALGAPAALAQTGYPGTPDPTAADLDLGNLQPGQIVNVQECTFKANENVNVSRNGVFLITVRADDRGCITLTIELLRTLIASGVSGQLLHPFAATGLAATANKVQVKVNGVTFTGGPYGTQVTLVSTGTGANGAGRTVTARFTIVKPGTVTRSGLVRTGTTAIKWTPLGLGLIGVGYLLVLATRRRRRAAAPPRDTRYPR